MATTVTITAASRRGAAHPVNEDAIGVNGTTIWGADSARFPPTRTPMMLTLRTPFVAAVADGVSGTAGARDAAILTASWASALGEDASEAHIRSAVNSMHRDLAGSLEDGRALATGSTVAGVIVGEEGEITLFHVGDSRIYYNSASSFVHSDDDVAPLPMTDRVVLSHWLGMEGRDDVPLHVDVLPPAPWRRMLLCSDGLVRRLHDQGIEDRALRRSESGSGVRGLEEVMADLFETGEERSDDDESAVLLDIFVDAPFGGVPPDPQRRPLRRRDR